MKMNKTPILDLSWIFVCLALGITLGSTCGCVNKSEPTPQQTKPLSPADYGIDSFKVDCGTLYYNKRSHGMAMTFVPDGTCCQSK